MALILGIAGYAHSGKDSVGDILVKNHGFQRRSVGDVVLDILAEVDPVLLAVDPEDPFHQHRMNLWLEQNGYEATKETSADMRPMMQRLGEACRRVLGSEVLIDATFRNCPSRMVMTSTRYRNEAQAIKDNGGFVWRVNRPGFGAINDHITETDMDSWDYDLVIDNDGSLEDLAAKVAEGVHDVSNSYVVSRVEETLELVSD